MEINKLTIDKLMHMKSQAIMANNDLVKEFEEVRKKLLKKGFKVITFENSKDRSSRLWFKNRRIASYDAVNDTAHLIFDDGYEGDFRSGLLNINRLIVIKTINEYLLKVA